MERNIWLVLLLILVVNDSGLTLVVKANELLENKSECLVKQNIHF